MAFWRGPDLSALYRRGRISFTAFGGAALFIVLAAAQAGAQDRVANLEWFMGYGASFLTLGHQAGTFQVQYPSASYDGSIVAPSHFLNSDGVFTGVRYRLTTHDSVEVSYFAASGSLFSVQPIGGSPRLNLRWEVVPTLSVSYARYLGCIAGWRPFLVGGVGVAWTGSLITGYHRTNASFDFGLGADLPLANGLALRLEARDYVAGLPSPFRGLSHDLAPTAGLVFSSRSSGTRSVGFPQIEIFLEGGASVLTGGSIPSQVVFGQLGGGSAVLNSVVRSSFSKSGRYTGGFRVLLTERNALEFEYSHGPNRYQTQESTTESPLLRLPAQEFAQSVEDYSAGFVRYVSGPHAVEPFIAVGAGLAHFAGIYGDIDKFSWNLGAGVDVPLQKRLALRFEMKDFMSPQPDPIRGVTHNLAPTVGLALRFK